MHKKLSIPNFARSISTGRRIDRKAECAVNLYFREITRADQEQLLQMKQEIALFDGNFEGYTRLRAVDDFETFISKIERSKNGKLLPPGFSPEMAFIALNEVEHIVGIIVIRMELTGNLINHGGNVGYIVKPSARGKGCGTKMLQFAVDQCRKYGMSRILVTCRNENHASEKVILRNGGIYENNYFDSECQASYKRYWIIV